MSPIPREDPYGAYNFLVDIDGIDADGRSVAGAFSEVSGMEVEIAPIEYRTGAEDVRVRKIPGIKKFGNITLKRGVIGDLSFWNWLLEASSGGGRRVTGTISLLNEDREVVVQWVFRRAWPCKWTGPALDAQKNEVALETLEIAHEGLSTE